MATNRTLLREVQDFPSILANRLSKNPWQDRMDRVLEAMILGSDAPSSPSAPAFDAEAFAAATKTMATRVRSEGVILFPGALSGEILDSLRDEFRQTIDTSEQSRYPVERHDGAVCVRITPRPSLDKRSYPVMNAFFDSHVFFEIARHFYRDDAKGFNFNSTIFVHETPETKEPLSGKLHWDRTQALKFWVYIDDVPVEAGPMRIEPGTTEANKEERIQKRKDPENLIGGKDNLTSESREAIRLLDGPAGTVLIHDSDCSHGASPVAEGYVRRIMRGHCRAASLSKANRVQNLLLNPNDFHLC